MLWGNTAYCEKLSYEDLLRYSNKIESLGSRKCPHYHYIITKVVYNKKNFPELAHIMALKQLAFMA